MQYKDLQTFTQAFYAKDNVDSSEYIVAQLFFLNGSKAGTTHSCDTDSITIGRSIQNRINIPSPRISKNHCEIIRESEKYYLIDHHSKNGTFLNNKQIKPDKKYALSHGDKIELCDSVILFVNPDSSSKTVKMQPIKIDRNQLTEEAEEVLKKFKVIVSAVSPRHNKK